MKTLNSSYLLKVSLSDFTTQITEISNCSNDFTLYTGINSSWSVSERYKMYINMSSIKLKSKMQTQT